MLGMRSCQPPPHRHLQIDMLSQLCGVLGTPTTAIWQDGMGLAAARGFQFPQVRSRAGWARSRMGGGHCTYYDTYVA